MTDDASIKVLDVRLANVEDAIMEMKSSQQKIGDALTELVKLATKHEEHRSHIEDRLNQLDELDDRVRTVETEMPTLTLIKRGIIAAVGLVLTGVFTMIWASITGF